MTRWLTWRTRLRWAIRSAQGWRIEGPYPRPGAQVLLLCGPSLQAGSEWHHYLQMRLDQRRKRARGSEGDTLPLIRHADTAQALRAHIELAQQHGLDIQLIQRSCRHRKIRCNSAFKVDRHAQRTLDYIGRIFSYPMGCSDVNRG